MPKFRKQSTAQRLALAKRLVQARVEAGLMQKTAAAVLGIQLPQRNGR